MPETAASHLRAALTAESAAVAADARGEPTAARRQHQDLAAAHYQSAGASRLRRVCLLLPATHPTPPTPLAAAMGSARALLFEAMRLRSLEPLEAVRHAQRALQADDGGALSLAEKSRLKHLIGCALEDSLSRALVGQERASAGAGLGVVGGGVEAKPPAAAAAVSRASVAATASARISEMLRARDGAATVVKE